jgi:hypothetical protein
MLQAVSSFPLKELVSNNVRWNHFRAHPPLQRTQALKSKVSVIFKQQTAAISEVAYRKGSMPFRNSPCRSNSLIYTNYFPTKTLLQTRNFTQASIFLALTKLLVGAGSLSAAAYIFFQWFNRRDPKQYLRIYTRLLKPLEIDVETSQITMERHAETRFLQQFFSSPPSGIVIVVGPSGSGKSQVMKQVLRGRKMAIYVDFKKDPILTGEEFIFNFVESTGYYLFVPSDFTRLFFRDEVRKSRITAQEAEKALSLLRRVLHEEKAKGWPNGVPIICLDDYHRVFRSTGDVYFSKFLDWCLHIEEAKLAHIVFVTSFSFAHLDLDAHPNLRSKRVILYVDYPSNQHVKEYFSKISSSFNEPLTPSQIEWIVKCIGGSMEDLDRVITALSRGDSYANILRRMVTDSINFVEDQLEKILQQASDINDEAKKEQVYGKYLRFWSMMEALRDKESVNRRDMIRLIFKEHAKELEDYIAAEIICYRNQKKEYIKSTSQPTTTTTSTPQSTSLPSVNVSSTTQQQTLASEQKKVGESNRQTTDSDIKPKSNVDPEAAIYISLLNESLDR